MKSARCVSGALLLSLPFGTASFAAERQPHLFDELAFSSDGSTVASIEHDEPAVDGAEAAHTLVVRRTGDGRTITIALPCGTQPACKPTDVTFSSDGRHLAFVLAQPGDPKSDLYEAASDGSGLHRILAFEGNLGTPRYARDGTLAVLATPGAHKESGAIKAGAPLSGEIGESSDEQRLGIVRDGAIAFVSPPDLYVYEYDWLPDGSGLVGTASPGNGDNNWWIAKIWRFARQGPARVIYTPPPKQQLASPIVSPDGKQVAFIGGLMSDFGSTGGDAFELPLDGRSAPVDMTKGMAASVTAIDWHCAPHALTATALRGADAQLLSLDRPSSQPHVIWSGTENLSTGGWSAGAACDGRGFAAIRQTFSDPPEIALLSGGTWRDLTSVNAGLHAPVIARSLTWKSDNVTVQGWLLQPEAHANDDDQKMITDVHGGPGAASTPRYLTEHSGLWLLDAGYDLFLPNPRGSFGQGEAFTLANVRDFGHGDLRDILRGVDRALQVAPISPDLLGLTGYSYGGYMTMWAVTQTDRFKAAVAGAGVSDWLSYYGENGIDRWMIPFFGASVYDDPAVYARSSPIDYIKHVKTPTFVYVGDRDLECPMPQSQEFWHALHELGVPTEFVVYPGQGHELKSAADRADAKRRTLAWFARWLKPNAS